MSENTKELQIHLPGKEAKVTVILPEETTKEDWKVVHAYVSAHLSNILEGKK